MDNQEEMNDFIAICQACEVEVERIELREDLWHVFLRRKSGVGHPLKWVVDPLAMGGFTFHDCVSIADNNGGVAHTFWSRTSDYHRQWVAQRRAYLETEISQLQAELATLR